jgi:hypothetical protein
MKSMLLKVGIGLMIAATSVTSVAASSADPVQGNKLAVVINADTVTGGGSPTPAAPCAQTNLFRQGQIVVFRMWGVNVKLDGVALTDKNVISAVVKIPGRKQPLPFKYGLHGTAPNQVSFWTAVFPTAKYPLGVVNFTVVVKTKAVKKTAHHKAVKSLTGTYSQKGFSDVSRLTVTP